MSAHDRESHANVTVAASAMPHDACVAMDAVFVQMMTEQQANEAGECCGEHKAVRIAHRGI